MTERFRVLILGYGEMGHAMEHLLKGRQQLDIWEKYPRDNFQSVLLEDVAPRADIVLFCLPVNPHREIVEQIDTEESVQMMTKTYELLHADADDRHLTTRLDQDPREFLVIEVDIVRPLDHRPLDATGH